MLITAFTWLTNIPSHIFPPPAQHSFNSPNLPVLQPISSQRSLGPSVLLSLLFPVKYWLKLFQVLTWLLLPLHKGQLPVWGGSLKNKKTNFNMASEENTTLLQVTNPLITLDLWSTYCFVHAVCPGIWFTGTYNGSWFSVHITYNQGKYCQWRLEESNNSFFPSSSNSCYNAREPLSLANEATLSS